MCTSYAPVQVQLASEHPITFVFLTPGALLKQSAARCLFPERTRYGEIRHMSLLHSQKGFHILLEDLTSPARIGIRLRSVKCIAKLWWLRCRLFNIPSPMGALVAAKNRESTALQHDSSGLLLWIVNLSPMEPARSYLDVLFLRPCDESSKASSQTK